MLLDAGGHSGIMRLVKNLGLAYIGLGYGFLVDFMTLKRSGALEGAHQVMEIGSQQIPDNMLEAQDLLELYALFRKPRFRPRPFSQGQFYRSSATISALLDVAGLSLRTD